MKKTSTRIKENVTDREKINSSESVCVSDEYICI